LFFAGEPGKSVLDPALDFVGYLGDTTATGAHIFPDTLYGVAGSQSYGEDKQKGDREECFHETELIK